MTSRSQVPGTLDALSTVLTKGLVEVEIDPASARVGAVAGNVTPTMPSPKPSASNVCAFSIVTPCRANRLLPSARRRVPLPWARYRAIKLGRRHYREVGRDPWPVTGGFVESVNETIDATVFKRWQTDAGYQPANLRQWAEKRRVDIDGISGTKAVGPP